MQQYLYTIQLFGRLSVRRHIASQGDQEVSSSKSGERDPQRFSDIERFRTQKTGALFAYLGCFADRKHSREVLTEIFWPEVAPAAARHNLSMAMSSLRAQFEPAPLLPGSVLYADRLQLGVTNAVTTDVARFDSLLDSAAQRASMSADRASLLLEAVGLYHTDLLPGYYEAWIVPEQERLAERFRTALIWLAEDASAEGNISQATRYARRAAESDPLDEEAETLLARLSDMSNTGDEKAIAPQGNRQAVPLSRQKLSAAARGTELSLGRPGRSDAPHRQSGNAKASPPGLTSGLVPPAPAVTETFAQKNPSTASPLIMPLTLFFGRNSERDSLLSLLSESKARLVTVAGPGGVGKTRLVQEALLRLGDAPITAQSDRVSDSTLWLRSKAPTSPAGMPRLVGIVDATLLLPEDSQGLLEAISAALGISLSAVANTAGALSAIAEALSRSPRPLLMLDNLESILPDGAEIIAALLSQAPDLICLVTSRVRLGIAGEAVVNLEPLRVPLALSNSEVAALDLAAFTQQWAGVALFVDRAQQVRPDFTLTRRNIRAVVQLVRFLEGLPLALELAAARIQLLSPAALLARIRANRFELLTGSGRRFGKRHASLQATLACSIEFLSPEARQFVAELSVFSGGFTLEDAEKLTSSALALDILAQLCDASLVRATGPDSADSAASAATSQGDGDENGAAVAIRFYQLETVRAFTLTLIPEDARDIVRTRHAQMFLQMALEIGPRLEGGNPARMLDQVDGERANLKAAMDWLLRYASDSNGRWTSSAFFASDSPDREASVNAAALAALRLSSELYRYWLLRGGPWEGRRWLEAALQATAPDARELALSATEETEIEPSAPVLPTGFAPGGDTGQISDQRRVPIDPTIWAIAVNRLGILAMTVGDIAAAEKSFEQALALRRLLGQTRGVATALGNLAILAAQQGNYESARRYGEEGLRLWREMDDPAQLATALANMGAIAHEAGDLVLAERLLRESVDEARRRDNLHGEAINRCNLGEVLLRCQRLEEAEIEFRACLTIAIALEATTSVAHGLLNLALLRAWAVNDPAAVDALAHRLRHTARRCLAALRIPRSTFIEEQEYRCFGFLEPSEQGSQRSADEASEVDAVAPRTHPLGTMIDDAGEDTLDIRIIAEQEADAAGDAALLLANLVIGGDLWYPVGSPGTLNNIVKLELSFAEEPAASERESA